MDFFSGLDLSSSISSLLPLGLLSVTTASILQLLLSWASAEEQQSEDQNSSAESSQEALVLDADVKEVQHQSQAEIVHSEETDQNQHATEATDTPVTPSIEEKDIIIDGEESSKGTPYVAPSPVEEKPYSALKMWLEILLPEAPALIAALLTAFASSSLALSLPKLLGNFVDLMKNGGIGSTIANPTLFQIAQPGLYVLGVVLLQSLLNFGFGSLIQAATDNIAIKLRKRLFSHIIRTDISYFDQHSTGEIISSVTNDVNEVKSAIKSVVTYGVRSTTQLIGGIASLFLISRRLTAMLVVLMPSMIAVGTVFARYIQRMSKDVADTAAKTNSVVMETIGNIRTVRAFNNEDLQDLRYDEKLQDLKIKNRKFGILVGVFQGAYSLSMYSVVMLVLLYGGSLVSQGTLSSGELSSYIMYAMNVNGAMQAVSVLQGELVRAMGSSQRIFKTLHQKPKIPVQGGAMLTDIKGIITFTNVSFSYPTRPQSKVLKNLSFHLEEGKKYALVGQSGSGKSTIASLIERFYDPIGGQIMLDNCDIRGLDPQYLRKNIALVSQEPVLFATSIYDNIRFGRPDATKEEIEEAAKLANADRFIKEFPQGYNTTVGERGAQLSGGQKQRIAIARAILRNAKILILDEATSALDSESEHLVQEALQRLMANRTVLIIAHRLSTIKDVDEILVIKNGQLVERGNHENLMQKNSTYAHLVAKQMSKHEAK
mmetsp:Transcript_14644/g.20401  ORF Transcript_14644/g.20401 Transcript_14644/m.20401 type:complete len:714 (-) Transcript_14644:85-2226(-)